MNTIIGLIKKNFFLYKIFHAIYFGVKRLFLYICWLFPIKKKRVVFISYYGKYYSDNPRAISDKLMNSDIELYWLVENPYRYKNEGQVKFVNVKSLKAIYILATSSVWVDNCRKEEWIRKRKKQYYIQTYHAAIPFKCVEGDAEEDLEKAYVHSAKNDGKMSDLMISNSTWCTNLIRRAFWFNGKILQIGSPRLDNLLNITRREKEIIKKRIGITDQSIGVILYAPTFRNNHCLSVYNMDYEKLCNTLKEHTGKEWVILVRLHFGMTKEAKNISSKNIINVTSYNDIYELVGITDLFITDYSSTMFEAAIVRKPVFIYAPDIEKYKQERPLYFQFDEIPFSISKNTNQLIDNICGFRKEKYYQDIDEFFRKLEIYEPGNASEIVADVIKKKLL